MINIANAICWEVSYWELTVNLDPTWKGNRETYVAFMKEQFDNPEERGYEPDQFTSVDDLAEFYACEAFLIPAGPECGKSVIGVYTRHG